MEMLIPSEVFQGNSFFKKNQGVSNVQNETGFFLPAKDFFMKIAILNLLIMGVETPMPPVGMNARRPEGRPAAGIITVEKLILNFHGLGKSPDRLMHVPMKISHFH
jgi:hypothetical protein